MRVLVLNSGSSSIKYRLFRIGSMEVLRAGIVDRIGEPEPSAARDHGEGFGRVMADLSDSGAIGEPGSLFGIGHRVVHGGEHFREPAQVDRASLDAIRAMIPFAPLHNPGNLQGIEVALATCPGVPQVAVFDTAFHQTMPPRAFHYALPRHLYDAHRVRRYGFHGTSHAHVARRAAKLLGKPPASLNLITLHLGNGASAAAIRGGKSVDTSMGMTPLEGLIMGTRCGDLDPAIPFFLVEATGKDPGEIRTMLNEESGLKGICGAGDMREVHRRAAAGDPSAELAVDMYSYRVRKYIGAYTAVLGRVDALVFTGGIGENDAEVRRRACEGLSLLGIAVDEAGNGSPSREPREIQREGMPVRILVIPTDEELEIALQTVACIRNH
ncbi:MAG TPA: acetate kinase, partial [Candidatus Deferrimicrobium sp.]|nr:acetate kinase [Candidatus Deferrimicrobium sp.]